MIKPGKQDGFLYETADGLARIMLARKNAEHLVYGAPHIYHKDGFHIVLDAMTDPNYQEVERIDGAPWIVEDRATLFNDILDALNHFHGRRPQVGDMAA